MDDVSTSRSADRQPYGWAIEYGRLPDGRPRVVFLVRDERNDLATVNQRAVDLRGVLRPLFDR